MLDKLSSLAEDELLAQFSPTLTAHLPVDSCPSSECLSHPLSYAHAPALQLRFLGTAFPGSSERRSRLRATGGDIGLLGAKAEVKEGPGKQYGDFEDKKLFIHR